MKFWAVLPSLGWGVWEAPPPVRLGVLKPPGGSTPQKPPLSRSKPISAPRGLGWGIPAGLRRNAAQTALGRLELKFPQIAGFSERASAVRTRGKARNRLIGAGRERKLLNSQVKFPLFAGFTRRLWPKTVENGSSLERKFPCSEALFAKPKFAYTLSRSASRKRLAGSLKTEGANRAGETPARG